MLGCLTTGTVIKKQSFYKVLVAFSPLDYMRKKSQNRINSITKSKDVFRN
jgi:hypothetical protein